MTSESYAPVLRHGAACAQGLDECDWPSCYVPVCVDCGLGVGIFPPFFMEPGGAASGPYCEPCAAGKS